MYILDAKHNPVKLEPTEEGFKKLGEFMAKDGHVVMQTKMGSPSTEKFYMVSTIFLCVTPSLQGLPMYETMIFDEKLDGAFPEGDSQYQARHTSWEDAVNGHQIAEKHVLDLMTAEVLKDDLN